MASSFRSYNILKYYKLGPLDLRSALTGRDPSFAVSMKNMMRGRSDSLTIRPGSQIVLSNQQCPGPQKGIFDFEGSLHFYSESALWMLSQGNLTFRNVSMGAVSVIQNIVSNQWSFRVSSMAQPAALAQDTFETSSCASWWSSDNKAAANYDPAIAGVVPYQTSIKKNGSYAARYHIVGTGSGGVDEQEPLKISLEYPKFQTTIGSQYADEIYVEYWVYFKSGYPWPASSQKTFRLGYDDGTTGTTNYTVGLLIQGSNSNLQLRCFDATATRDVYENVVEATAENTWIKFGIYAKLNDVGYANGIASLYRNDVRIAHMTNVEHRGAGQESTGFSYFWVGGNYSNSGPAPATDGDIYYDDIKVYTYLPVGLLASTDIFSANLGTGLEANPYPLYSLQQAITASGIGGTLTLPAQITYGFSPNSLPAAHIPKMPLMTFSTGQVVSIPYYFPRSISWESGYSQAPFTTALTQSVVDNLKLPMYPTQTIGGTTYIAAREKLYKYDSQNVTSAGLTAPTQVTLTNAAGGSLNGTYQYLITFSRFDAYGNELESEGFTSGTVTTSGAQKVTLSNLQGRSGWRPDFDTTSSYWGAVIEGNQTVTVAANRTMTLTMDDGAGGAPKLDVNDTIYLKNNNGGTYDGYYNKGRVLSVTGHSVVFDNPWTPYTVGTSWAVTDNAPVAPVVINIYRTQTGPSALFYRITGVPIDITAATQSIDDTTADASVGSEYIFPEVSRTPFALQAAEAQGGRDAINCLALYRGSLLVGIGKYLKFSDIESPEYFPGVNSLTFNEFDQSVVIGVAPRENHFIAFKQNSCAIIAGEIVTGQYTVDLLSNAIGCVSPFTIQNIGGVIHWVDKNGVYRQAEGGKPELISLPIQPVFRPAYQAGSNSWVASQSLLSNLAVAGHDPELKQYIAYIPYGYYDANNDPVIQTTRVLVFNYEREEWYEWDSIEMARGLVSLRDRGTLVGGKENNALTSATNYLIRKKIAIGDKYDYSDGVNPIVWSYESSPETLGEPAVEKKAVTARIESLDPSDVKDFSVRFRLNQTRFPGSTDATKSITSTIRTALVKIKKQRGTSHSFTLSGSSLNEKPVITGVQIQYSASFSPFVRKED